MHQAFDVFELVHFSLWFTVEFEAKCVSKRMQNASTEVLAGDCASKDLIRSGSMFLRVSVVLGGITEFLVFAGLDVVHTLAVALGDQCKDAFD